MICMSFDNELKSKLARTQLTDTIHVLWSNALYFIAIIYVRTWAGRANKKKIANWSQRRCLSPVDQCSTVTIVPTKWSCPFLHLQAFTATKNAATARYSSQTEHHSLGSVFLFGSLLNLFRFKKGKAYMLYLFLITCLFGSRSRLSVWFHPSILLLVFCLFVVVIIEHFHPVSIKVCLPRGDFWTHIAVIKGLYLDGATRALTAALVSNSWTAQLTCKFVLQFVLVFFLPRITSDCCRC